MSADVINLQCQTRLDLPVDRVLTAALEAGMTEVVIVGYDADGNDYFASSKASAEPVLWHLERAKWRLMRQVDDLEKGE